MESDGENEKFVALIEDYKVILDKSQNPAVKEAKQSAIIELIQKWSAISGKTLTQKSILKKLSNLKTRTKTVDGKKQPLSKWQTKLLEITKGSDDDEEEQLSGSAAAVTANSADTIIQKCAKIDWTADDIVNRYESPETRKLSNNQLKRIILLEQVKILQFKRQKLESKLNAGGVGGCGSNVEFEYVDWNEATDVNEEAQ